MTTKAKAARSRILEAVHETATDLHRLGFIDKHQWLQTVSLGDIKLSFADEEVLRHSVTPVIRDIKNRVVQ